MSNLTLFREELGKFVPDQVISDKEHWDRLMNHLCDVKLLHPKQVKILQQTSTKRVFPVTLLQLQEIIMKQFGNQQNKALLQDLLTIQKQIRETKGILSIWKDKGLTTQQINAMNILFARGNHRIKEICTKLNHKKVLMESICEQQIQLIRSMDQWIIMQKIKRLYENYEEYQQINEKSIQTLLNKIRVREVHFRNKNKSNKNISKSDNPDVQVIVGFNSKNDEPVEVTRILKKCTDFDQINSIMMTCNAQRDMLLSPYFLRFKGYNHNLDHLNFLYFREYAQGKNLKYLITKSTFQLDQQVSLFKFWAGQIFRALRDLYIMCSYFPILPIRLEDFFISEYGLKVTLKGVKFQRVRELNDNIQPQLLQNLSKLILELLKITPETASQKIKNVQNFSLITALLKARQIYQNYKQKIIPCHINFFNIQTHPLFESNQQTQGMEIINNFTALYGDYYA